MENDVLKSGEVIFDKWSILQRIGEGTFSQIFSAFSVNSHEFVAVKVEIPGDLKPVLESEANVLKIMQPSNCVCRYYQHGMHENKYMVLVMEMLGEPMSKLRQSVGAEYGIPVMQCISAASQMLDCIREVHDAGFLHRDIKPSNFARGLHEGNKKQEYFIIDFGLAKKHLNGGQVVPKRERAEFRGTSLYASLTSHRLQDMGRKDDLWSLFYIIVDFLRSELPWKAEAYKHERAKVQKLKTYYTDVAPLELLKGVKGRSKLYQIMQHLQGLQYEDRPNYDLIKSLIRNLADDASADDDELLVEAKRTIGEISKLVDNETAIHWQSNLNATLKRVTTDTVEREIWQLFRKAAQDKFDFVGNRLPRELLFSVQNSIAKLEKNIWQAENMLLPVVQSFEQKRKADSESRREALEKRRRDELITKQRIYGIETSFSTK